MDQPLVRGAMSQHLKKSERCYSSNVNDLITSDLQIEDDF